MRVAIRFRAKKTFTTDYLKFCIGLPVVQSGRRAVGVWSCNCQSFSDGQFTTFSYPLCSAVGASSARAPLSFVIIIFFIDGAVMHQTERGYTNTKASLYDWQKE